MIIKTSFMTYALGLVLTTQVQSQTVGECRETTLPGERGHIAWSSSEEPSTPCHIWVGGIMQRSTITVSITQLNLVFSQQCTLNYLSVREKQLCDLEENDRVHTYTGSYLYIKVHHDTLDWREQSFSLSYLISASSVEPPPCRLGDFRCSDGRCILYEWRCNKAYECSDHSDEINCQDQSTSDSLAEHIYPKTNAITTTESWRFKPSTTSTPPHVQATTYDENITKGSSNYPCGSLINQLSGIITSYPRLSDHHNVCHYTIMHYMSEPKQVRFTKFQLLGDSYIRMYEGTSTTRRSIGLYKNDLPPPRVIEANDDVVIYLHIANYSMGLQGFEAIFQSKGICMKNLQFRCHDENDCYMVNEHCDGYRDCPLYGSDEMGCNGCGKGMFWCGHGSRSCYSESDRCDGQAHCKNPPTDELGCGAGQCGTHNGTYLCHNGRCIPENWLCDGTADCPESDDEVNCQLSRKVTIAAIIGSLTCSLLLVIALGCTYKLHLLHSQQRSRHRRYVSPLTQVQEEIMASRSAPPPYLEAMRTSRSFDEVQREFIRAHAAQLSGNTLDPNHANIRSCSQGQTGSVQGQSETTDTVTSRHSRSISSGDEDGDDDDDVPLIDPSTWVSDEALIDISMSQDIPPDPSSNVRISTTAGQETAQWCRQIPKPENVSDSHSSTGDISPEPAGAASPSLTNKTNEHSSLSKNLNNCSLSLTIQGHSNVMGNDSDLHSVSSLDSGHTSRGLDDTLEELDEVPAGVL